MTTLYSFTVNDAKGVPINLASYHGKVLLIVNVASQCGFTQQYTGLEQLYREFRTKGLEILAFPCNQFGAQEPGSDEEIQAFCRTNYSVTFPVFAKLEVKGSHAHPLYHYLVEQAPGVLGTKKIKWNFTKFLVNAEGHVIKRYAPITKPMQIRHDLLKICPA